MKSTIMSAACLSILLAAGLYVNADAGGNRTENKNITLISAQSTADGKSEVWRELLEECVVSLPKVSDLEAEVTAQPRFLKEINGETGRNQHTQTYSAAIEINYMIHQKELIIITTSSVQGQEPITKVVERNIRRNKRFDSDPGSGDIYANRSQRQYFFSSAEKAVEDVKQRAAIWLKQQNAVVCADK